ncbi:MAG: hypothetical protein JST89_06195 [Cyanobacteria bacterium SZAS-4]|nr:hypothetical protein [Cyanobacteria bacterium SZAS-4]
MELLNKAFSFYRRLLSAVFEMIVLITIGYATNWNIPVFLVVVAVVFIGHQLFHVLRELYPNWFVFRDPTLWFFGAATTCAMTLLGLAYGLVYVKHW